ncbi:MAG: DcrB-related protein [Thermoproteota archaeon]|nr:DcrB-related protein [Thermoproteota archaeon]
MIRKRGNVTLHISLLVFIILLSNSILSIYYNCQQSAAQTINTPSENVVRKTSEFVMYTNPIYGFKILYPANWEKIDFGQTIEEDDRHIVVTFLSPLEGTLDRFREYLIIQVGEIMFNRSLEQYVDNQVNSLRRSLPNFEIVESNATAIKDNLAYTIVYIFKIGKDEYKVTEVWITKDNKLYYIKYSTELGNSDNYESTVRKMIDSFRIIG